jgi:hypothetical protein
VTGASSDAVACAEAVELDEAPGSHAVPYGMEHRFAPAAGPRAAALVPCATGALEQCAVAAVFGHAELPGHAAVDGHAEPIEHA